MGIEDEDMRIVSREVRGAYCKWMDELDLDYDSGIKLGSITSSAPPPPRLRDKQAARITLLVNHGLLKDRLGTVVMGRFEEAMIATYGDGKDLWVKPMLDKATGTMKATYSKAVINLAEHYPDIQSISNLRAAMGSTRHKLMDDDNGIGNGTLDIYRDVVGTLWCDGLSHACVAELNRAGITSEAEIRAGAVACDNIRKTRKKIGNQINTWRFALMNPAEAKAKEEAAAKKKAAKAAKAEAEKLQTALELGDQAETPPTEADPPTLDNLIATAKLAGAQGLLTENNVAAILRAAENPVHAAGQVIVACRDTAAHSEDFKADTAYVRLAILNTFGGVRPALDSYMADVTEAADIMGCEFTIMCWVPGEDQPREIEVKPRASFDYDMEEPG